MLLLNLLTIGWLGGSALVAARRLAAGHRDTLLFAFPIHFVLTGLPLVWDTLFGVPEYQHFPGFYLASTDPATRLVYCFTIALAPALWWIFRKPLTPTRHRAARGHSALLQRIATLPPTVKVTAALVLALPILLVLASPDPAVYLRYTPWQRGWSELEATRRFHFWISRSIPFAFVAATLFLLHARRVVYALALTLPFVAGAAWISGKRNAVASAAAFLLYALWKRGVLRGRRLIAVSAAMVAGFALFSVGYQTQLRFPEQFVERRSLDDWIEGARIDFGRDNVIRVAVYSELDPAQPRILDYRGQSYLDVLVAILRLERIDTPSYPNRLTTVAMGKRPLGSGGVTTSIFDESIANFAWFGLFIAPLAVLIVCRIGDSCDDALVSALTLFAVVGLFTSHLPAWANVAVVWALVVGYTKLLARKPTLFGAPLRHPARGTGQESLPSPRHVLGAHMRRDGRLAQVRRRIGDRYAAN